MVETNELKPNTLFIEVSGSGLPEVDGLFVPSTAPPAKSESGTVSSSGYWNGKMAWDRQTVYAQVRSSLAEFTDKSFATKPLTEKSEMLLGLRPFPRKE